MYRTQTERISIKKISIGTGKLPALSSLKSEIVDQRESPTNEIPWYEHDITVRFVFFLCFHRQAGSWMHAPSSLFCSDPSTLCSSQLDRCYVTDRLLDTYTARGAPKANEGGPTVRRSETTLGWGSLPLFRRDCAAWLVMYFLSFSLFSSPFSLAPLFLSIFHLFLFPLLFLSLPCMHTR